MTIEELGDKLMDKSNEAYWKHCDDEIDDEGFTQQRYWEGWSDALEWVAKSIRDGLLGNFELEHPIETGWSYIDGNRKRFFKYPPGWSEEQKEEWRREHGG